MPLRFSTFPGKRERHLLRKQDNPLFPAEQRQITPAQLEEAQRLDHEELVEFISAFRALVHEATRLPDNAESTQILSIKERLDQTYEQAARMVDNQREIQQGVEKLVAVVMQAVRRGAGNDAVALQELADEEAARTAHYALLAYPLVADLLDPESVIEEHELLPSLLSASADELQAACSLFDQEQLTALIETGKRLLEERADVPDEARERLRQLSRQRDN
ncbi:hypothetical protein [Sedimenticola thiotaurini]|uniref:Uncharacterized protein n=1 Tax=Sedimenticola thiotaurini TaxID=1543721 RepID=A0A0F7K056_9GAMM|nr:hypothetical protein [Sedimenticola thiotaurini]AKH21257.1 hypothetical protein AAY24_13800 [Sedimenticola thiotaurini]